MGLFTGKQAITTMQLRTLTKQLGYIHGLADAYHNRGLAYEGRGEIPSAFEDFSKAIELNPNYAEAYNNRGIVHGQMDDYDRAIEDYTKAIELNPNLAEAYTNRGLAYSKKDECDLAI